MNLLKNSVLWLPSLLLIAAIGCGPKTEVFEDASKMPADSKVEVPPSATKINVIYGSGQHTAMFDANTKDVEPWVEMLRGLNPELNANPPSPHWLADTNEYLKPSKFAEERHTFGLRTRLDEEFNERMLKYVIVRSDRGAVTTIWHDPETSRNYLWAVYK